MGLLEDYSKLYDGSGEYDSTALTLEKLNKKYGYGDGSSSTGQSMNLASQIEQLNKRPVIETTPVAISKIEKAPTYKISNSFQYVLSSLGTSTLKVAQSLNPTILFDNAYRLFDTVVKGIAYTGKLLSPSFTDTSMPKMEESRSFTQALNDTRKDLGIKPVDTKDMPRFVKEYVDDWQQGINHTLKSSSEAIKSIEDKNSAIYKDTLKGTKIISDVVNVLPQLALLYASAGTSFAAEFPLIAAGFKNLYSISTVSSNIAQQTDEKGKVSVDNMNYAISSSVVQIASESVFGLVKGNMAIFKGALERAGKKGAMTTMDYVLGVLKQGGEEGLEEVFAYPFQLALDKKYQDPNNTLEDVFSWEMLKNAGYAGLIGFIAGAGMSIPGAIASSRISSKEKEQLKDLYAKITKKEPKDVTKKEVEELLDIIAKADVSTNNNAQQETQPIDMNADAKTQIETLIQNRPDAPVKPKSLKGVRTKVQTPAETVSAQSNLNIPNVKGKNIRMQLATGESVDSSVNAVQLSNIISSMDADMNPNANYPEGYQPRNTDKKENMKTVVAIATDPKFEDLLRTEYLQQGTPVITNSGIVIAGNHRVAGFLKMLRDNPKAYAQYKQYVKDHASELGIDPSQLQGDFIIVRTLPDDTDLRDTAIKSNADGTQKMSSSEQAKIDASLLTNNIMTYFVPTETGEIDTKDNRRFISEIMEKVIPSQQHGNVLKDGKLTQDGYKRIESMIFYKAYGSDRLLESMSVSKDEGVQKLLNALIQVAPSVVKHDYNVENGTEYDVGISKEIAGGAEMYYERVKSSSLKEIYLYASQQGMEDTPQTLKEKQLLLGIYANRASKKQISAYFMTLLDAVRLAGNPKEAQLFDMGKISINEITEIAQRKENILNEAATVQSENSGGDTQENEGKGTEVGTEVPKKETVANPKPKVTKTPIKSAPVAPKTVSDVKVDKVPSEEVKAVKTETKAPSEITVSINQLLEENTKGKTRKEVKANIDMLKTKIEEMNTLVAETKDATEKSKLSSDKAKMSLALKKVQNFYDDMDITKEDLEVANKEQIEEQTKIEEEKKKEKSKTSKLVEESQAQDMSGVNNIIPKSVQGLLNSVPATGKTWKDTISPETMEAIDKSTETSKDITWKEKLAKLKDSFKKNVTYGAIAINPNLYGDIRDAFRMNRISGLMASKNAEQLIYLAYNKVGKDKLELMQKAILYFDLAEDVAKGRYNTNKFNLFKMKSPQEVIDTANAIRQELLKPENEVVVKAMQTRKDLMDETRDRLVAEGKKADIDMSIVYSKDDYMYHATLAYREEMGEVKKASKKNGKIKLKGRVGSDMDFIADTIQADFLILTHLEKQINKLKLYNQIKKQDISSTIKYDENGQPIIKDGYKELSPAELGVDTFTVQARQKAAAIAIKAMTMNGINPKSKQGKKLVRKAVRHANKTMLVVPSEIADAVIKEFERPEHGVSKIAKKSMNVWKYTRLKLPTVVVKYNARNLYGDIDVTLTGRPQTVMKVPQALKDLYKFYYQKGVLTQDLKDYIDRTGMSTGEFIQELKSLKNSKLLDFYAKDTSAKGVLSDGFRILWKKLTLETETEFREQVLRYAAYLSIKEELENSNDGLPKYYMASIPGEIQTITDVKTRAAKMANDLLGAYDDTSITGQYLADHLIPFYRFKEVQVKRYYRMVKNAFYSDPSNVLTAGLTASNKAGVVGRVGLSAALRIGKLAIGVSLLPVVLSLFNNLVAPEEEEKLPENVKSSLHITIPSWALSGDSGRVYYLDRLGSFSELFNMFGIDGSIRKDLGDILEGRMSYEEKIKEIAMAPIYDNYNSMAPFFKIYTELLSGKQMFPNPSSPTAIRDRWEYIFKNIGLADEYKALAGKPLPSGSYFEQKRSMLFNSVQANDSAYWDLAEIKERYYKLNDIGKSTTSYSDPASIEYKRSNAMYYYKQAIKLNDTKAAEKYLKEYAFYGGTNKTKKASFEGMNPLQGMSNLQKKDFIEWLTPEEKKIYERAMNYYEELKQDK